MGSSVSSYCKKDTPFFLMDEITLLQGITENLEELRQTVYCAAILLVFGVFATFGRR